MTREKDVSRESKSSPGCRKNGRKRRQNLTSQEKTAFRAKKSWKEFRERMLKLRGLRCELTGVKLTAKTAQVHHLRPDLYDTLEPELFKVLSPSAHDFVEAMAMVIHGNTTMVPNKEALMAWIGPFLPTPERTVDKYYAMLKKPLVKDDDSV